MRFDLTTPCKECPFIIGSSTNKSLPKDRIEGIITDIRADMSFTCHKTLLFPVSKQQHCAGALVFLENESNPNQNMRIAERLGIYNHKKLNMSADVIDSGS